MNFLKFNRLKSIVDSVFVPDGSGGVMQKYDSIDMRGMSPLISAYIGDAYYNLYVRSRLLSYEQHKVNVLNRYGAQMVSAVWQSRAYEAIEPTLTDEERDIFRRGRNAHSHAPRAASFAEYHASTGFEALLGELYLSERFDRLNELCEASFQYISKEMAKKHKK